jgi:hypothetical protein
VFSYREISSSKKHSSLPPILRLSWMIFFTSSIARHSTDVVDPPEMFFFPVADCKLEVLLYP